MKTILITGANGALGKDVVASFLAKEYRVVAIAHSGSELGFAQGNSNFQLHELELMDEVATADLVRKVTEIYGGIDGALLLAGGFAMGTIQDTSLKDIQAMVEKNFNTAYNIIRPVFQHMLSKDYGRIVLVGARTVLQPAQSTHTVGYTLSKSMLFTLAEILNATAKGKNVSASVVVPSTIDTAANRESMPDADFDKWVTTEAIAEAMAYICSNQGFALREPVLKLYNKA